MRVRPETYEKWQKAQELIPTDPRHFRMGQPSRRGRRYNIRGL